MTKSSLWAQENETNKNITELVTYNNIDYFQNVKVTMSESQDNIEDSCLVNYSTGKVFQLKDGAKYADQIDGLFLIYCGAALYTPQTIITCGGSCGVSRMNGIIVEQKWKDYRRGTIEFMAFPRDDDPTNNSLVARNSWSAITSSETIEDAFKKGNGKYTVDNDYTSSNIVSTTNNCKPDILMNKTLRRFLTQDGRKGLIRLNSFVATEKGYSLTFDIKIQKSK
ncbi:hypothetical protein LZD49_32275 [Dyadobacter sp. CY261]|uniref:hypothetical protein n=1 Tax=Dyadobacter sp. CY261 TaxID=2907203 RepID=UPI001F20F3BD|nr:hypothetical protein [Dyadobacter sp. CY261]MCF0075204.1 hypothetical protein [Dyadobacter sp. CY261]